MSPSLFLADIAVGIEPHRASAGTSGADAAGDPAAAAGAIGAFVHAPVLPWRAGDVLDPDVIVAWPVIAVAAEIEHRHHVQLFAMALAILGGKVDLLAAVVIDARALDGPMRAGIT